VDNQVETAMLAQMTDMIPIEELKKPVTDVINTCGEKGDTTD
jgi:hypothetical protein